MITELTGKITFANGLAAPEVLVRVFDRDAPGKIDDDMTIVAGKSGPDGVFTVKYDPGRFVDFATLPVLGIRVPDVLDILAPYLQLTYSINGLQRVHQTPLVPFKYHYRLPEAHPLDFKPSQNGFAFYNYFPPITLPFTLPGLPKLKRITGFYGLCGGMSAAASDYFLAGCPVPSREDVPASRTRLYKYIFRRAMDSFRMGESILRFAEWMALDDEGSNGLRRLSLSEFERLREALDNHQLVPLGLVISAGKDLKTIMRDVWLNHQVLAYAYTDNADGSTDVRVYDPNMPRRDDVSIRVEKALTSDAGGGEAEAQPLALEGVRLQPVNLRIDPARIRGFFMMPYEPAEPPRE